MEVAMKNRTNLIALASPLILLLIAIWFDRLDDALRTYAGLTFDFASTIGARLGLTLVYGLLLTVFLYTALVKNSPDLRTFWFYVGLATLALLLTVFTYVIPIDLITSVPNAIRAPFIGSLTSYTSFATVVIFWVGIVGLLVRNKMP
jgi:hypothetical protein